MNTQESTNTPVTESSPRFTLDDTQGNSQTPIPANEQPAPMNNPDQSMPEKEINILDGFDTVKSMMPFEDSVARTGDERVPEQTTQEPVQKSEPKQEAQELIFGKYRDMDAANKGFKDLTKSFHSTRSEIKRIETDYERRMAKIAKERDFYREQTKDSDAFDPIVFNNELAVNPAEALDREFQRRERVKEREAERKRHTDTIEKIKQDIDTNIEILKTEYPEFSENSKGFSDWMTYYRMDTGRVMGDLQVAKECYRDYLDAHQDLEKFASEQREQGQAEAEIKSSQVPASTGNVTSPQPHAKQPNPRFTQIQKGIAPVQEYTDINSSIEREISDPLDVMEGRLGVGGRANRMW